MNTATKEQVSDYVKSLGGTTSYSGNTRTMYVHGLPGIQSVHQNFPVTPFAIVKQ